MAIAHNCRKYEDVSDTYLIRIVRAFLIEEQKIVKKVVKTTATAPKAEKPKKKSSKK
jgi:hypothetical protein